ncbi:MAG TPA: protein kinase [Ktedonobacteraceae bacterium]|nr:protein kinase [Ktedonobacteraceae bacterium]
MALEELQNGRYRRVRLVGSGGMGEVYLMEDTRVSRQVAIKVLRSEITPYPDSDTAKDAARLFQREARAIAALEHPNILPLYDFGEETLEDTTITYMVMPFTSEGSLATWLRQRSGLLSPRDAAYLIGQAAEGLQYAHDHKVIHLDVKPSNFLLRSNAKDPNRPTVLLADFGVARSSSTTSGSSRTIRGTPASMAPEHWSSKPVPATDQYALAVMAYEMLTGRTPFTGSMEQLMYQHFTAQPAPPSTYNPQLPPTVDAVILRALSKKAEDRFPSIASFASALEQAVSDIKPDSSSPSPQAISAAPTILNQKDASLPAEVISGAPTLLSSNDTPVQTPASAEAISALPTLAASDPGLAQASNAAMAKLSDPSLGKLSVSDSAKLFDAASDHDLPTVAASGSSSQKAAREAQPFPVQKKEPASPVRLFSIISVVIVILLVGGGIFAFQVFNKQQTNKTTAQQTATAPASKPTGTPTPVPTVTATVPPGMYIADTYNGSMLSQPASQTTYISVYISQKQGSGAFLGSLTLNASPQDHHALTGTVDMQGNFTFTVVAFGGQQPLYVFGSVQKQSDGTYLKGQYCHTTTNSCVAIEGYFYVGPGF